MYGQNTTRIKDRLEILNEDHGLRRRYLESLSTPDISTYQLVINPHHVIARPLESGTIVLIKMPRSIAFLGPLQPPNVIVISFTTERAGITCFFDLLPFVEDVAFVHESIVAFYKGMQEALPRHDDSRFRRHNARISIFGAGFTAQGARSVAVFSGS